MGKISNYTRVLLAKLQDVFVVDSTDNNVTTTKSVTVEQIGDAICGTQVHSDLDTDDKTIIGGINEVDGKTTTNATAIGDLSALTTSDNDSLVDAVNEVDGKFTWQLLSNALGSGSIDISGIYSTAKEIKVVARTYTSGQVDSSQMYTVTVLTNELSDFLAGGFTELHYSQGMNNGQTNIIDIGISSTIVHINTFILNGNDVKNNATTGFRVYYR